MFLSQSDVLFRSDHVKVIGSVMNALVCDEGPDRIILSGVTLTPSCACASPQTAIFEPKIHIFIYISSSELG